ncbi:uncharacterized protein LOC134203792 [Armigeres subalbatus]|uniref:uncharacterized protein LOC134203792 n=1 Tax=Armigeres subalbatus TaxID=124917 RepID=UPI002ED5337B
MSAAERRIRGLKNRKRSIISSMSGIASFVSKYQAERDKQEVSVRLENLIALWSEFNSVQGEMETLEEDDDVLEAYLKERTEIERVYYKSKGIDFWGPIYLKPRHRRDAPPKAYVSVFVCFSTKAVHLELVVDLSTAKFLQAFRRFISRRGLCTDVYSDNGKNFVGAAHELRKLLKADDFRHAIAGECSKIGIRWHFNPPRGSHFGGLWEAAIKSAQKHFVRVLGDRKLAFDDMETLLVQIEGCLNSRPLMKLSDDPTDLEALTPGHFLVGSSLQSVPDVEYDSIPMNRLYQWQQIQKMLQDVWKRWHVEYLHSFNHAANGSNHQ